MFTSTTYKAKDYPNRIKSIDARIKSLNGTKKGLFFFKKGLKRELFKPVKELMKIGYV